MGRGRVAGVVTSVTIVLLVVAAASGPVRLWTTPQVDVGPSEIEGGGPLATVPAPELAQPEPSSHLWGQTFLQILAVLVIVLAVTAAVWLAKAGRLPTGARRRVRERRHGLIGALPEVAVGELAVDVSAARQALGEGSPRNAIVACWMQLERDVAAAGLPRAAPETSTEYVERVVIVSSLEPGPIRDLAALYREARFSSHRMSDDHRARALAALDRVEAALRRAVGLLT